MSINPIMTTIINSLIANVCVNTSDRSSTTTTLVVVIITNYCGSYSNSIITTFILFTSIRFNASVFTGTISTTIMITVTTTISISVAVTSTLPSILVLTHIIMMNTIVAIIVTLVSNCIINVTIITASNSASILSLLLLVRVSSSAQ